MTQKKTKILVLLSISIVLAFAMVFLAGTQSANANGLYLDGTSTPTPLVTPTPTPGGSATNIFYNLLFPSKMISDALGKVFVDAADAQSHQLVEQYAQWYQAIGDIMQAPNAGDYSRFAQSSWPVAAALAPALFLLRIALYQWNRLVGEEDSAARAAGDILTALILAVLCGWFLDLVVRLGYWMAGAAVGESGDMAISFIKSMSVDSIIQNLANDTATLSFMSGILFIAVDLGALLAVAGMLIAFAAANAGLFLLAVLGPSISVVSCDPTNALVAVPVAQSGYGDSLFAFGSRGSVQGERLHGEYFYPWRHPCFDHSRYMALGCDRGNAVSGRNIEQIDHLHNS
jgi:hypothetical protein